MYLGGGLRNLSSISSDTILNETWGTCQSCIIGCPDFNPVNYDSMLFTDPSTCIYIFGCTDPLASNYDPSASIDTDVVLVNIVLPT